MALLWQHAPHAWHLNEKGLEIRRPKTRGAAGPVSLIGMLRPS